MGPFTIETNRAPHPPLYILRDLCSQESSPTTEPDVPVRPVAQVLANYGYTQEQAGLYYDLQQTGVPRSMPLTAAENFLRESRAIVESVFSGLKKPSPSDPERDELREKLAQLQLSNKAVWGREHAREAAGDGVWAPWFLRAPYLALCVLLDVVFDGRPVQRFWFLETVARTPYFSYNTMLYIYEVLGWWRRSSELRKVHFAEEWNEYHHLLVMESLGGDQAWIDRFLGQHSAVLYYFALVFLWLISPAAAYNFSELIEVTCPAAPTLALTTWRWLSHSRAPQNATRLIFSNWSLVFLTPSLPNPLRQSAGTRRGHLRRVRGLQRRAA